MLMHPATPSLGPTVIKDHVVPAVAANTVIEGLDGQKVLHPQRLPLPLVPVRRHEEEVRAVGGEAVEGEEVRRAELVLDLEALYVDVAAGTGPAAGEEVLG